MTGNMYPLLQSECDEQCKWYIDEAEECTAVALANNLWWGLTHKCSVFT